MKTKRINKNTIEIDGVRYTKEDSSKWLDIPELNISVEIEVHDKNKSFRELNLFEREEELMTYEECRFIMNTPKYAKALKMEASSTSDDFFIKQPYDLNRKNGYVARFYVDSDRVDLRTGCGSDYGGSDLGVRFVRRTKEEV